MTDQYENFDEDFNAAMESLAEYEKEIEDHNNELIKSLEIKRSSIKKLLDSCDINGKMALVDIAYGSIQDEKVKPFKKIYVDQWGVGMEGDSWEGNIYAQIDTGHYLKVPYKC